MLRSAPSAGFELAGRPDSAHPSSQTLVNVWPRSDGSGCRQQRGTVPVVKEVMLGQPELVVAQPFHEDGKLAHVTVCSGPMPRLHRRALEAEEPDSESHRSSASD